MVLQTKPPGILVRTSDTRGCAKLWVWGQANAGDDLPDVKSSCTSIRKCTTEPTPRGKSHAFRR